MFSENDTNIDFYWYPQFSYIAISYRYRLKTSVLAVLQHNDQNLPNDKLLLKIESLIFCPLSLKCRTGVHDADLTLLTAYLREKVWFYDVYSSWEEVLCLQVDFWDIYNSSG